MSTNQPQAYYMPAGEAVLVDDVNGVTGLEYLAQLHKAQDSLPIEEQTKVVDIRNVDGTGEGRCLARYVRVYDRELTDDDIRPWRDEVRSRMVSAGLM